MKLFHYTTIDTLALILNSKSLRFSRLDQLDDKMESEPFAEFNPLSYIFSSSFTYDEVESIPMWKMYSNMETGVRIEVDSSNVFSPDFKQLTIPPHKHECCKIPRCLYSSLNPQDILNEDYYITTSDSRDADAICQTIRLKKISYINDFKVKYQSMIDIKDSVHNGSVTRNISYNPFDFGFYKSEYWAFQKEVRFLIYAIPFAKDNKELSLLASGKRPLSTKNIFVPVSNYCLSNLKIRLAPKISEASRIICKALVSNYPNIIIEDSLLYNTIR